MVRVPQADHAEPGPGAVWTAGRVARELGIAESTLRAWHHRYGVGPHNPRPGRYRRYTPRTCARCAGCGT